MRVVIAYNEPVLPPTHPEAASENDILLVVAAIEQHLAHTHLELTRFGVGRDLDSAVIVLQQVPVDIVLNLFEGFGDDPNAECQFARLLEESGIAFTGSSSNVLRKAGRKDIAKQLLTQAGLPTPAWSVIDRMPPTHCRLNWPVIVKPAFRDASVGIDQASVVTRPLELAQRIAHAVEHYALPVLVEEFIAGREVSAAVVDREEHIALPLVETKFIGNNGAWPIDSYDAKWRPGSRENLDRDLQYPADLPQSLAKHVSELARSAYRALGCRGFATIDFRISDSDTPYILDVNPNADLKPTDCLIELLRHAGLEYADFMVQMIDAAAAARPALDRACRRPSF